MATIINLRPGQVIYDVRRATGLAAFRSTYEYWRVTVIEVNEKEGYIIGSWNSNPPRKMSQETVKKYRLKPPKEK